MKFPPKFWSHNYFDAVEAMWNEKAKRLGMEYGVYITVEREMKDGYYHRIYFQIGEHECESLRALRKLIRNRTFL